MKNLIKTLIKTVFPLMVWGLFACHPQPNTTIYQAESLMDTYPDSALLLLETIRQPEKLSAEEYATWCLLLTQAQDKNYVEHTSDSVIGVAVKYFEKHKDLKRLTWAYYYLGVISSELGESVQAQSAFLKAQLVALKIHEPKLLGRIYENLGNLYDRQGLQDSVLVLYHKALFSYQAVNDSVGVGLLLRNIGRSYVLSDVDSAEQYYQKSLLWLSNNRYQKASVLNDLGILYKRRGENELSLQYIKSSLEVSGYEIRYINSRYLNMGDLYLRMGQTDSALFYLNSCLTDAETRTAACACLSKLYGSIGDWKTASSYKDRYIVYADSVYQSQKTAELAMQLKQYDKEKAIAIMQQKNLKSQLTLCLVVSAVIIILLVVLLVLSKKNRSQALELSDVSHILASVRWDYGDAIEQKKIIENNYRAVCDKLNSLERNGFEEQKQYAELEELKNNLKSQLEKTNEEVCHLKNNVANLRQYLLEQSLLYRQIVPLIGKKHVVKGHKVKVTAEDWEFFFKQMDQAFDGLARNLKDQYQLKDDYLGLACLIIFNIKPCNLPIIYNITSSGVSNKRKSLALILNVSIDDLDDYLQGKIK